MERDEHGEPSARVAPGAVTNLLREICAPDDASRSALGSLPSGTVVGRFLLLREIGRGGFGVVYEARDQQLHRAVAFKLVRGHARSRSPDRLLREAEAIAQLSHPNLVTLYDVGRCEHGAYLVLELLRGETLAKRLRRGRFTAHEAVLIAREIARGLAHVHEHGIVHRDLKPANAFLCETGAVKLLDFGMAQAFGCARVDGGTPGYMAPEQRRGAPEDERTDVFAMGVLLCEMISGAVPRDEPDAAAARRGRVPLRVPECPDLEALVARSLEPDPVDRPRHAGEILAALEDLRWAAIGEHTAEPIGTRRILSCSRTRSSPAVTLAVLPLANLSGDAGQEYFSDGMTDEIIGKLSRIGGLAVTGRTSVSRYKGRPTDPREIGAALGVAYLLEGSVRRAGERIRVSATLVKTADGFQLWSEHIDAKLDDVFDVQERVATRIVEALHVQLTTDEVHALGRWGTRDVAAYDEYLRGQVLVEHFHMRDRLEAARVHFERALRIDPNFAPALAGLASAEAQTYRNIDSDPARLPRAQALVERALAVDPTLVRALFASGEILGAQYDYAGAAQRFREVVALEPRNYAAWDYLGWALGYLTPPPVAEAERACRTAIHLNPSYAESYYHLARILLPQDRLAEAEEAIAHMEEHYPGAHLVYAGRFWIAMAAGRPRDALAMLELDTVAAHSTNIGRAWVAMALAQLGRIDEALSALRDAVVRGYRDIADLRGNGYLKPLRDDPRFAELLRLAASA